MTNLKRKLLAVAMCSIVSAGAFAQKKGGGEKRPPKPPNTVVATPKGERPPQNENRGKKDKDKRGRP